MKKKDINLDKVFISYNELVPEVHQSEDDDKKIIDNILAVSSLPQKERNLIPFRNSIGIFFSRYRISISMGFALIVIISSYFIFTSNQENNRLSAIKHGDIINENSKLSEPEKKYAPNNKDTILLATISLNEFKRGSDSKQTFESNDIYKIIGNSLRNHDIEYTVDTILKTNEIYTNGGMIVLIFEFQKTKQSVEIIGIMDKSFQIKKDPVDINNIVNGVRNTLKIKVRMLDE